MASTLDITAEQGATFRRVLALKDADNVAIDITGAVVNMQVRRDLTSPDVILEASTTNGRITIVGATGTITIVVLAADMEAIASSGIYDLFVQFLAGDRVRILKGLFTVERAVTDV